MIPARAMALLLSAFAADAAHGAVIKGVMRTPVLATDAEGYSSGAFTLICCMCHAAVLPATSVCVLFLFLVVAV
jgi:hypothetical protein